MSGFDVEPWAFEHVSDLTLSWIGLGVTSNKFDESKEGEHLTVEHLKLWVNLQLSDTTGITYKVLTPSHGL